MSKSVATPTHPLPPFIDAKLDQVARLCRRFKVKRLELFGSASTGAFKPKLSDLDFIVDFGDQSLGPLGPWARRLLDFADALEDIFGRKVDLIMPQSIGNPYFQQAVDASRRLVYET